MPSELPRDALDQADAAVVFAQQVRRMHRRRSAKTAQQRQDDIARALQRIKDAMRPIRSHIGQFPYGPQTSIAEENRAQIREASAALQRERRKLWKMQVKKNTAEVR